MKKRSMPLVESLRKLLSIILGAPTRLLSAFSHQLSLVSRFCIERVLSLFQIFISIPRLVLTQGFAVVSLLFTSLHGVLFKSVGVVKISFFCVAKSLLCGLHRFFWFPILMLRSVRIFLAKRLVQFFSLSFLRIESLFLCFWSWVYCFFAYSYFLFSYFLGFVFSKLRQAFSIIISFPVVLATYFQQAAHLLVNFFGFVLGCFASSVTFLAFLIVKMVSSFFYGITSCITRAVRWILQVKRFLHLGTYRFILHLSSACTGLFSFVFQLLRHLLLKISAILALFCNNLDTFCQSIFSRIRSFIFGVYRGCQFLLTIPFRLLFFLALKVYKTFDVVSFCLRSLCLSCVNVVLHSALFIEAALSQIFNIVFFWCKEIFFLPHRIFQGLFYLCLLIWLSLKNLFLSFQYRWNGLLSFNQKKQVVKPKRKISIKKKTTWGIFSKISSALRNIEKSFYVVLSLARQKTWSRILAASLRVSQYKKFQQRSLLFSLALFVTMVVARQYSSSLDYYGMGLRSEPSPYSSKIIAGMEVFDINRTSSGTIVSSLIWFEFDAGGESIETIDDFGIQNAEILEKSIRDMSSSSFAIRVEYSVVMKFSAEMEHQGFPFNQDKINILIFNKTAFPQEIEYQLDKKDIKINLMPTSSVKKGSVVHTSYGALMQRLDFVNKIHSPAALVSIKTLDSLGVARALFFLFPLLVIILLGVWTCFDKGLSLLVRSKILITLIALSVGFKPILSLHMKLAHSFTVFDKILLLVICLLLPLVGWTIWHSLHSKRSHIFKFTPLLGSITLLVFVVTSLQIILFC